MVWRMKTTFDRVMPGMLRPADAGQVVEYGQTGTGSTVVLRRRVQGSGGDWEDVETLTPGSPASLVHTGDRSDYCLFCTSYGGTTVDAVLEVKP